MADKNRAVVVVFVLAIAALWVLNSLSLQAGISKCITNNDCSANPKLSGCILVEGYCGKDLCRVPACLNDRNIDWIRHTTTPLE